MLLFGKGVTWAGVHDDDAGGGGCQDGGTTYRMAGRGRGAAGDDEVGKEGPMVLNWLP